MASYGENIGSRGGDYSNTLAKIGALYGGVTGGSTQDGYQELFEQFDAMRDQYGPEFDEAFRMYMGSSMNERLGYDGMGPMIPMQARMPGMMYPPNFTSFSPGMGPRMPYAGGGLDGMLGAYGGMGGIRIDIYEHGEKGGDGQPKYSITLGNTAGYEANEQSSSESSASHSD